MGKQHLNLVVLAALLHDVGKLLERGMIFQDARKDDFYLNMCPQAKGKGYSTHLHAAHSRKFCDWLEERFDCLRNVSPEEKEWKNWCGAHHLNDESGLESSVIRYADRLSSSERDEGSYYRQRIQLRTRLEPVTERVSLHSHTACLATHYRFPLAPLSVHKQALFPQNAEQLHLTPQKDADKKIDDPSSWTHLIADHDLTEEYAALGKGLMTDLEILAKKNLDISLEQLLSTMTFLLERYTVNVPSATNVRHPDISLFDHLKTTAAIAQAMYLEQLSTGNGTQGIGTDDDPKWLLVCGDFSGIQNFIYNLTNKGAAKGLRGRSFYVQFFCQIAAEYTLRKLGLCRNALLYDSGGKFYLLIPHSMQDTLYAARDNINAWLMEEFDGTVFLGLGLCQVTAKMFKQGQMDNAWKETAEDLERDRLRKFSSLFTADFFQPQDVDPSKSCEICGSRKVQEKRICPTCDLLTRLGSWLRYAQAILIVWGNETEANTLSDLLHIKQKVSLAHLGCHAIMIPEDKLKTLQAISSNNCECLYLNEFSEQPFDKLTLPDCAISGRYVGKWNTSHSTDDHDDWDFEDFANNAEGIKRMGVLRMDVDNLGLIFIQGLQFPEREEIANKIAQGWGAVKMHNGVIKRKPMASISRMVTLSRQLNQFFSGYVPSLLRKERFQHCQIIYAGGDDLFIIGSWDQLPHLAWTIKTEFAEFCCLNPEFTISGGMTLQRGKYPIFKGAMLAGDAEERAKTIRHKRLGGSETHKDGFCFQNIPIVWEDMEYVEKIKELLHAENSENRGLAGFLSRMTSQNNKAVRDIRRIKKCSDAKAWEAIAYNSWRWRTAYQLKRRYRKAEEEPQKARWSELLFANKIEQNSTLLPVISWLEFPIRWSDYLQRDNGGN
ncbi:MAG: type III-A CRISPR-associated protein Cas10/Csm1 [Desulfoplanes sp.]